MTDAQTLERAARSLRQRWLIVTDLDGTLLDHHSYSHQAVDELLAELESRGIPVIFNTSKTFAELIPLRKALNNRHPFVVENGSAIYIPRGYFARPAGAPQPATEDEPGSDADRDFETIVLGRPASEVHGWLDLARHELNAEFIGFAEMSTAELAKLTGLDLAAAELAGQRCYSEAIQWLGDKAQREQFCRAAQAAGFRVLQGGRFLHLLGRSDKGKATRRLAEEYTAQGLQSFSIIAAGDGNNDIDMLEAADLAIAIRSPVNDFPALSPKVNAVYSAEYGPTGWADTFRQLLSAIEPGQERR